MKSHYTLKTSGYSSAVMGDCEVCHKHCSEVFMQTQRQEFSKPDKSIGLRYVSTIYGHNQCLVQRQKKDPQNT